MNKKKLLGFFAFLIKKKSKVEEVKEIKNDTENKENACNDNILLLDNLYKYGINENYIEIIKKTKKDKLLMDLYDYLLEKDRKLLGSLVPFFPFNESKATKEVLLKILRDMSTNKICPQAGLTLVNIFSFFKQDSDIESILLVKEIALQRYDFKELPTDIDKYIKESR